MDTNKIVLGIWAIVNRVARLNTCGSNWRTVFIILTDSNKFNILHFYYI